MAGRRGHSTSIGKFAKIHHDRRVSEIRRLGDALRSGERSRVQCHPLAEIRSRYDDNLRRTMNTVGFIFVRGSSYTAIRAGAVPGRWCVAMGLP